MMELMTVTLKEKWGKYKAGEEIQVDSARAATLIEAGLAASGKKKRKTKTFRVAESG